MFVELFSFLRQIISFPTRYKVVMFMSVFLFGMVIFQVFRIQSNTITSQLYSSSNREREIYWIPRGNIYDRNENLLAGNKPGYEIGVDLLSVQNPEQLALIVSDTLNLDYQNVLNDLSLPYRKGISEYIVIDDYVNEYLVSKLQNLANEQNLSGLQYSLYTLRNYPENDLGANILGISKFRDRSVSIGYYGVEQYYNELLGGRYSSTNGQPANLVLTIEKGFQRQVETVLDQAIQATGSKTGSIIVMNSKTGEILAMASTPNLNLNEYWKIDETFPDNQPYNNAISFAYEPGSIFNILTLAAAFDIGTIDINSKFFDTGAIFVGGVEISNWDGKAWGEVSMQDCLYLNVCMAWLGTKIGAESFYGYLHDFGIGKSTYVDLEPEYWGILSVPGSSAWYPVSLGTNSFGQGLAVTPLQMTLAASAFANNGTIVRPHIVKKIIYDQYDYEIPTQYLNSPISEKTSVQMSELLAQSLEQTSPENIIPDYSFAGKSGLGQIADPVLGYSESQFNSSFIGWGPLNNPQLVIHTLLNNPSQIYDSKTVTESMFFDIAHYAIEYFDIPSEYYPY